MKDGNVFGSDSQTYDAYSEPVWLEVKEKKTGGGSFSLSGDAKGDSISMCAPVSLAKMGGTAVILDAYEVEEAIDTSATAVKLKKGIFGTHPAAGMVVGKMSDTGSASKAAALGAYTEGTGFAITAGALGALAAQDFLYIAVEAGSSKAAVLPVGLSWRGIYVDTDSPTYASVAIVTKGQFLCDRVPAIAGFYQAALTGITFEKEL